MNVLGASPPSAPSKAYTVMGSNQTNPRPVDGPYITYSEAINETTIILKWTVSELLNMPMNYSCNFLNEFINIVIYIYITFYILFFIV